MKTLTERLNLVDHKSDNDKSVAIDTRKDINYYDTLCLYCAEHNINLDDISDSDFDSCSMTLEDYAKSVRHEGKTYISFWIDKE